MREDIGTVFDRTRVCVVRGRGGVSLLQVRVVDLTSACFGLKKMGNSEGVHAREGSEDVS
jgi:hypothetical protein